MSNAKVLGTKLGGSPDQLGALARWLRQVADKTDDNARRLKCLSDRAESAWQDPAGEKFGEHLYRMRRIYQAMSDATRSFADQVEGCSADLSSAQGILAGVEQRAPGEELVLVETGVLKPDKYDWFLPSNPAADVDDAPTSNKVYDDWMAKRYTSFLILMSDTDVAMTTIVERLKTLDAYTRTVWDTLLSAKYAVGGGLAQVGQLPAEHGQQGRADQARAARANERMWTKNASEWKNVPALRRQAEAMANADRAAANAATTVLHRAGAVAKCFGILGVAITGLDVTNKISSGEPVGKVVIETSVGVAITSLAFTAALGAGILIGGFIIIGGAIAAHYLSNWAGDAWASLVPQTAREKLLGVDPDPEDSGTVDTTPPLRLRPS